MLNNWMSDEKTKLVSIHYDSILDYMEDKPPAINEQLYREHAFGSSGGSSWYGPARTAQAAMNRGLLGDKELYQSLQKQIDELRKALGYGTKDYRANIMESRRVRTRGYQGDELDIHRVYQGRLDSAWSRTERVEFQHETKLVTIMIDNEANAGTSAMDSLWRSAAAVVLTDELLAAGKQVRLMTYGASGNATRCGKNMTVTMTIKNYNDSLSNERLAAMSHVGFARACGFAAQAMMPYQLSTSLGYSMRYEPSLIPLQFRSDIEAGHTKVVYLGKANNKLDALVALKAATASIKENKNA